MKKRWPFQSANWPFWLLIAAWFCANVPSMAAAHAFEWFKGARHFSHYAELRESVAGLLSKSQPTTTRLVATEPVRHALPPAGPADGLIKKIDLSLTPTPLRLVAVRPMPLGWDDNVCPPVGPAIEVPYPPPRSFGRA